MPVGFMEDVFVPLCAIDMFHVGFNVHPAQLVRANSRRKNPVGTLEVSYWKLIACLLWLICKSIFFLFKTEGGQIPGRKLTTTNVPSGVSYERKPQMDDRWRLNSEMLIYWKGKDSKKQKVPWMLCPWVLFTLCPMCSSNLRTSKRNSCIYRGNVSQIPRADLSFHLGNNWSDHFNWILQLDNNVQTLQKTFHFERQQA